MKQPKSDSGGAGASNVGVITKSSVRINIGGVDVGWVTCLEMKRLCWLLTKLGIYNARDLLPLAVDSDGRISINVMGD